MRAARLAWVSVWIALPASAQTVNNRKLDTGEVRITRVCVMPVEAEWTRLSLSGQEGVRDQADEWSVRMEAAALEIVRRSSAEAVPALPDRDPATDEARQIVMQVGRRYDTIALQLHKKPGGVRKGRYGLGDQVMLLPCAANVDAILFLHSSGHLLTRGKQVFGVLATGDTVSWARLYVTFADARSGEVLSFTRVESVGDGFWKDPLKAYHLPLIVEFEKMRIGRSAVRKKQK